MRFVECDGFRQLLAFVEHRYRPPSAMYISSLVKKQHLQLKNKPERKTF